MVVFFPAHTSDASHRSHKLHDPLVDPGTADLTADVDFSYLRSRCSDDDVLIYGPVEQGDFLRRMGMEVR